LEEHQILSTYAASTFALLNPLGMLPVFIGYTAGLNPGVQRWLASLVSLTVLGLLLLFLLTGPSILHFFGISLDAFRMAGGILLLLIGIHIVTGESAAQTKAPVAQGTTTDFAQAESVYRQIVIPFAMPLLVGPGVIANLILYSVEAQKLKSASLSFGLIGITVGIAILTLVILLSGRFLRRFLGEIGLGLLTRLLGLLVAAIGMQFLITGSTEVIVETIAPRLMRLGH
jgi:MarC family membrane protein